MLSLFMLSVGFQGFCHAHHEDGDRCEATRVKQVTEEELRTHGETYDQLLSADVPELNNLLAQQNFQGVIIP